MDKPEGRQSECHAVRQGKCGDRLYQKPGAPDYQHKSQHKQQMVKSSKYVLNSERKIRTGHLGFRCFIRHKK